MGQALGRMKAAWIVGAVAVTLVVSGGPVLARSIPCAANSECIGTKQDDTIRGPGSDGKGGDDELYSGGASDVYGGSGNDRLTAAGTVESKGTSGGFNNLRGGKGDDKIKAPARHGYNAIFGEDGDDAIDAKNGAPDDIDCGLGKDTVSYDAALDSIANCEKKA
jgi:hypothetical protein